MTSTTLAYGLETSCAVYAGCHKLDMTLAGAQTKNIRILSGVGLPHGYGQRAAFVNKSTESQACSWDHQNENHTSWT
jgi:hypothetical protein